MEVQLKPFFTSAVDLSSQLYAPLVSPPWKESSVANWMGPRAGVNVVDKQSLSSLSGLVSQIVQPISQQLYLGSLYYTVLKL
jgi:hypothetical protein